MKKDQYDVIIIGAGIGGLTCGCYLAKAGMKVLIVEQHHKVGGYCTSFTRKQHTFDVSCLVNCAENKILGRIINELEVGKYVKIKRANPSYLIYTPEYKIPIYNNFLETIEILNNKFPDEEKGIDDFFDFITKTKLIEIYPLRKVKSFDDKLNESFKNEELKNLFKILANRIGTIASRASVLTVISYFRELVLDSGYYVEGGLQNFADALAKRFSDFGGELLTSSTVVRIKVDHIAKVTGIVLENGKQIDCKRIVSNADPMQTFLELIDNKYLDTNFKSKLLKLETSNSVFSVYLCIDQSLKNKVDSCYDILYSPTGREDNPFDVNRLMQKDFPGIINFYMHSIVDETLAPKGKESISLNIFTPYMDENFWNENKNKLADKIIKRAEDVIPDLADKIYFKEVATPITFFRYTLNKNGAMRGLASIVSQIDRTTMPLTTFITNLYLVGHWVTLGSGESGLPTAAFTGYKVSRMILRENKMGEL